MDESKYIETKPGALLLGPNSVLRNGYTCIWHGIALHLALLLDNQVPKGHSTAGVPTVTLPGKEGPDHCSSCSSYIT